jgi:hypothetical protein
MSTRYCAVWGRHQCLKSIINVRVGRFDRHTGQKGVPGSRESSVVQLPSRLN